MNMDMLVLGLTATTFGLISYDAYAHTYKLCVYTG